MSKTLIAIATLIGTIIGAGILGIPYVIMKSGLGIGLFHLILVGVIMTIVMLYLGEIALRTRKNHQLAGYAEKYLGKKGKILMFIAFAFGIYSAILAYLIGEGNSLSFLFFNNGDYSLQFGILFWFFLSILTYSGLKALEEGELIGITLILGMVVAVTIFSWDKIEISNLIYNNYENFFVPFGVILFAFLGFAAIPEVERILGKDKKPLKKTILFANILVFFLYLIFTIVVLGFKGSLTPQLSTIALGKRFIVLGILTMFTSYLALSIALIDSLKLDFHISKNKAFLYVISIPLALFILLDTFQLAQFTKVLGIGGVISGGLTAILILFMVKSAKKNGDVKPAYSIPYSKVLNWILILIFVIGAVLEISSLI